MQVPGKPGRDAIRYQSQRWLAMGIGGGWEEGKKGRSRHRSCPTTSAFFSIAAVRVSTRTCLCIATLRIIIVNMLEARSKRVRSSTESPSHRATEPPHRDHEACRGAVAYAVVSRNKAARGFSARPMRLLVRIGLNRVQMKRGLLPYPNEENGSRERNPGAFHPLTDPRLLSQSEHTQRWHWKWHWHWHRHSEESLLNVEALATSKHLSSLSGSQ